MESKENRENFRFLRNKVLSIIYICRTIAVSKEITVGILVLKKWYSLFLFMLS